MADLEFFFDPMCPWAWITSRWVVEVRDQRDLDVQWRFISLAVLNEEALDRADAARAAGEPTDLPEQYRAISTTGARLLRVAAAARDVEGNDAVDALYSAAGQLLHTEGRSRAFWRGDDVGDVVADTLSVAGMSPSWADAADDDRWDAVVADETELALKRTGPDVGTPIITWDLDRPDDSTMFGPVISRIPRGDEALRLWDAMAVVARTPGMAEFKRSLRSEPRFD
jgi:2-hydroxychromene-2-carboxylate isomerase